MIFVEGDAVDIARTMQYLIVDGLSENEKKSNYIVRKCSANHEPFVINTVREEKIIFDGTALMNEQGELLCYQCFELGMTVVDCDDHEKEKVPSFIDLATVEVGVGTTNDLVDLTQEQYVVERHYTVEQINFLLENKQVRHPNVTRLANTDKFFLRTSLPTEEVPFLPVVFSKEPLCFDKFINRTAHNAGDSAISNTLNAGGRRCTNKSIRNRRTSLLVFGGNKSSSTKATDSEDKNFEALNKSGRKFIIIPNGAIFDIVAYDQYGAAYASLKCATATWWTSSISKQNSFRDLKKHGGVEILMFDDNFTTSRFAVLMESTVLPSTITICADQDGVITGNKYGFTLTNDPISLVLEKASNMFPKPSAEIWTSLRSRFGMLGEMLWFNMFPGNSGTKTSISSADMYDTSGLKYQIKASSAGRKMSKIELASGKGVCYSSVDFMLVVVISKTIARFLRQFPDQLSCRSSKIIG